MNVAVVLEPAPLDIGGGQTMQTELLGALLACADDVRHRFVVFGPSHLVGGHRDTNAIRFVPVDFGPLARVASVVERAAHNVLRLARPAGDFVGDPRVARIIARADVDFTWHLTPYTPGLDVPFLAVVWDLQHRIQPYFPEISSGRTWSQREQIHSTRLRRAMVIVTGTEQGRTDIERLYQVPSERIRVVGFPTPAFALEAPEDGGAILRRHGLQPGYLFYPAQFWPHKNHAGLLQALRELRDRHGLTLSLVLCGSDRGTLETVRAQVARLGLEQQVRLLGFVPQPDLPALYRGAAALAFVSYFGPDNLPPLEAFALGCPVVAADVPGASEQLGEAAVLVDPRSPTAIAAGLRRVVTDRALADRLIADGRRRALSWTGRDYVRSVFGILDDVEPLVGHWRQA